MESIGLAILIVDENRARASIIEEGLLEAGHHRVHVVKEMTGLVREIEAFKPDVIVVDLENPNRDRLEQFFQVTRTVQRPIAMFVDRSDAASMESAIAAGVSAYIVDGLKKERVKPILDMAILATYPRARRSPIRVGRPQGDRAGEGARDGDARHFRGAGVPDAARDGDEREEATGRHCAQRRHRGFPVVEMRASR
jgi:CheY-like chemotaxis protein